MAKTKNPSSAPTKGPGKGATKRLSAEEHAAIRRAKKDSQNANARAAAAHKQESGGTYIEGLIQERRQEAQERRERHREYKRQQAEKRLKARIRQANLAADMEDYTKLEKGTTAEKMARAIIGEFPTAEPTYEDGKCKISRTDAAIELALLQMSDEDLLREAAICFGIRQAKKAMYKAYQAMNLADKESADQA